MDFINNGLRFAGMPLRLVGIHAGQATQPITEFIEVRKLQAE
jgi:hypothetical protein